MDSTDSEGDGEDGTDILYGVIERNCSRRRIPNYIENVVHLYSNQQFKAHFQMDRQTFQYILRLLSSDLNKKASQNRAGRETISPEKQLLLALWTFSTTGSYRSVCDRFNVGRATAVRTVRSVVKALIKLKSRFINWPDHQQALTNAEAFQRVSGFPGVIGIIDGTHIKITAPKEHSNAYINRKHFHSIQLQVVCDHTRKFMHCYVGQPGCVHDQRVLRISPLVENLENEQYFPQNTHLIGDAAYSLHPHLLVPYRDNGHLTQSQSNYNYCLSSTRMRVEQAIGLLKGRFRSLLDKLPMKRTDLILYYILACCILHNICINLNDFKEIPLLVDINGNIREPQPINILRRTAERKRQNICDSLLLRI